MRAARWLLVGLFAATAARAQQPPAVVPPPGAATTVQLPTFSVFTVQTTVSVPDRGAAYLGGISRGREGATARGAGPLALRGLGSERGTSGASVHATITDHRALDAAVLAAAAAKRTAPDKSLAKAAELVRHVEAAPVTSVAAIRAEKAADAAEVAHDAAEYFAKAEQAAQQGKAGVARIYYQMALRRDPAALKTVVAARLAALAATRPGTAGAASPWEAR